jgi:hypothetical protein
MAPDTVAIGGSCYRAALTTPSRPDPWVPGSVLRAGRDGDVAAIPTNAIVGYGSSTCCLVRMAPVSLLLCRMRTTVIRSGRAR